MAIPTNHLQDSDQADLYLALPYGRHIGKGDLTMSINSGSASPNHQIKLRQALSEGPGQAIDGIWYAGVGVAAANYTFHNGTQTTSPAAPFEKDYAHYGTCMVTVTLPVGTGDADVVATPPDKLVVLGRFLRVENYDSSGTPTGATYSAAPPRVIADMCITRGGIGATLFNWTRWDAWKTYLATTETVDYTSISGFEGIGLKGTYYADATFTLKHTDRIDPSIYFEASTGSPAFDLPVDNFSVLWEGKIKAKTTGTYTFKSDHDESIKLWVNNLTTPLIDQAAAGVHTNTISLTADTFYDIKIEWVDTTSTATCILYWTPPAGSEEVIPQQYLYPKVESKTRYEAHALFEQPTSLDAGVRHVLTMCNSFVQQADGKYDFYCFDEVSSSFSINSTHIKADTFKFYRRDTRDVVNRLEAVFRDLGSQYLTEADPPIIKEYLDNQNDTGRVINRSVEDLDSMTHWQARKVMNLIGKLEVEKDLFVEFDGSAALYAVLPGDVVTLTFDPYFEAIPFLVVEAIDYSIEDTPERRHFVLMEWT